MSLSFPVSFLLGSALADSVGVKNQADRVASGVALAMTGGSPVGIVLARQLAINRASAQVPAPTPAASGTPTASPPATSTGTPPAATPTTPPRNQEHHMDKLDKGLKRWLEAYVLRHPEMKPEEVRQHLINALSDLSRRLSDLPPLGDTVDRAGFEALSSLFKWWTEQAQQQTQ